MSENEMVGFHTAIGGYNKKEVNEYIASMNQKLAEQEAAFQKEKEALLDKVSGFDKMEEAKNSEIAKLNEELVKAHEEITDLLFVKKEGTDEIIKALQSMREDNKHKETELTILKDALLKQTTSDEENIEAFRQNMELLLSELNGKLYGTQTEEE